jgi:hypothetical protein
MPFEPLVRAIATQYEVFTAARPRQIAGCEGCATPQEVAALLAVPREELSATALDFYARKAISTVGGEAELRYFWPRLAQLAIAGAFSIDHEIVFGKPLHGRDWTWPANERAALVELARALGQWLGSDEFDGDADVWVCSIGLLVEGLTDIRPILSPLLETTSAASANLSALVDWNRSSIEEKQRLTNAFWSSAPASAASVLAWHAEEPRVRQVIREIDVRSAELYGTPMPARPPHITG